MHAELREKVARIVAPGAWSNCDQNGRAWAEQWTEIVESEEQADAIIATIRDALLSDEVVEAGAAALAGVSPSMVANVQRELWMREALNAIQAAIGRATHDQ